MEATGKDLVGFFEYAAQKGLMKRDWANTLKGSCKAVLSSVEPEEWESVALEGIDVDAFVRRFERLKMGDLKPDSLNVYGRRFRTGLTTYLQFLQSPSTWQYPSPRAEDGSRVLKRVARPAKTKGTPLAVPTVVAALPHDSLITYPYPLRPGLVLTVALPSDLTQKEAGRLSTFLHSLAVDEQRALTAARNQEAS